MKGLWKPYNQILDGTDDAGTFDFEFNEDLLIKPCNLEDKNLTVETLNEMFTGNHVHKYFERGFERVVYCALDPGNEIPTIIWSGIYQRSNEFEMLYEFLVNMGYVMSDVEKQILDGTHPIYKQEDSDGE